MLNYELKLEILPKRKDKNAAQSVNFVARFIVPYLSYSAFPVRL